MFDGGIFIGVGVGAAVSAICAVFVVWLLARGYSEDEDNGQLMWEITEDDQGRTTYRWLDFEVSREPSLTIGNRMIRAFITGDGFDIEHWDWVGKHHGAEIVRDSALDVVLSHCESVGQGMAK